MRTHLLAVLLGGLLVFCGLAAQATPLKGFHGIAFGTPIVRVIETLAGSCKLVTAREGMFLFECSHATHVPAFMLPLHRKGKFAGVVLAIRDLADPIPAYEALRTQLTKELGDAGTERCVTHTNDDLLEVLPERSWQLKRVRAGQALMVTQWLDEDDNQVMLRTEFHPPKTFWVTVLKLASLQTLGLVSPPPLLNIGL